MKMSKIQKEPKVSVIVPVHDTNALFLRNCLDSLLAQSYRNYEIIIIDDGSKNDATINVLQEYKKKSSVISLTALKNNVGVSAARNKGIEKASGEYILFVDADDYLGEEFISEQVNAAKTHGCEVVLPHTIRVSNEGEREYDPSNGVKAFPKSINLFIDNDWLFSARGVLYSARLAKGERFKEDQSFAEDTDYSMRVIRDNKFVVGDKAKYHYVQHGSSVMHIIDEKNVCAFLDGCFEMEDTVARLFPSEAKKVLALKYSSICHASRCLVANKVPFADYKKHIAAAVERCGDAECSMDGAGALRKIRGKLLKGKKFRLLYSLEKATRPVWRHNG